MWISHLTPLNLLLLPITLALPIPPTWQSLTTPLLHAWPPLPTTHRITGPLTLVFETYGRALPTPYTHLTIKNTLAIQEEIMRSATPVFKDRSLTITHGFVSFNMRFEGEVGVEWGQVFEVLDWWRVLVGAWGPREIGEGVLRGKGGGVVARFGIGLEGV